MEVHFLASQEEEDKITEIKQKWVSERQNRRVDFSENKAVGTTSSWCYSGGGETCFLFSVPPCAPNPTCRRLMP